MALSAFPRTFSLALNVGRKSRAVAVPCLNRFRLRFRQLNTLFVYPLANAGIINQRVKLRIVIRLPTTGYWPTVFQRRRQAGIQHEKRRLLGQDWRYRA